MQNNDKKQERLASILKDLIAKYLNTASNGVSLITVTDLKLSARMSKATAFISVFPVEKEEAALDFAKRQRGEIREYLKENVRMRTVPFIEVEIDPGEKHRQRIDELLNKI
jgi:ribosome-binding factor A